VLFTAYYFAVALPAQRADRLDMEARVAASVKADVASKHTSVADCLAKVQADAEAQWTAACKARKEGRNCPLPARQADAFDNAESVARNACLIGTLTPPWRRYTPAHGAPDLHVPLFPRASGHHVGAAGLSRL
jgi:hypothetical protein